MVSDTFEIPLIQSGSPVALSAQTLRSTTSPTVRAFVGGAENRLVPTALENLLAQSNRDATEFVDFNPLVLCGRSGIGKSLLAHCLASHWQAQHSNSKVGFYSGKDWSRAYVQAIKDDAIAAWREDCRRVGLFVVDDITQLAKHFIAQRELVLLLDDLIAAQVPIIATSPIDLLQCDGVDSAITSRLSGGLVIQLQPPGPHTRRRIVQQMTHNAPRNITSEAQQWFATQFSGSVPALQNALLGCLSRAKRDQTEIGQQELRRLHAEWLQLRSVSLKAITKSVSRYCQIPVKDMIGSSRRHSIVQARSLAMYLAKQLSGQSLRAIGQHFGGRDHTTVLHACQKIEANQPNDPALRMAVDELTQILSSNHGEAT